MVSISEEKKRYSHSHRKTVYHYCNFNYFRTGSRIHLKFFRQLPYVILSLHTKYGVYISKYKKDIAIFLIGDRHFGKWRPQGASTTASPDKLDFLVEGTLGLIENQRNKRLHRKSKDWNPGPVYLCKFDFILQ
jgi:hypothetical protein